MEGPLEKQLCLKGYHLLNIFNNNNNNNNFFETSRMYIPINNPNLSKNRKFVPALRGYI